jgi:hypothetical protein
MRRHVFLEKSRPRETFGISLDRKRAFDHVRKGALGEARVVRHDIALGALDLRKNHAVGIGNIDHE